MIGRKKKGKKTERESGKSTMEAIVVFLREKSHNHPRF